MKKIVLGLIFLVAIIGVASIFLLSNLDSVIAEAIKKYGTEAVGSKVEVAEVKTDITAGEITVKGLTVANPQSYSKPMAFQLNDLTTKVDYTNKEIAEIVVQSPIINAELVGMKDLTNVKGIKNNFKDLLDGMPASDDSNNASSSDESGDELEITIRSLKVVSTKVNLITDAIGQRQFVMEDFFMNDIKGTPSAIASLISDRLINHVSDQVTQYAKSEVKKLAKNQAKEKLTEAVNKKLKNKLKGFKLELK